MAAVAVTIPRWLVGILQKCLMAQTGGTWVIPKLSVLCTGVMQEKLGTDETSECALSREWWTKDDPIPEGKLSFSIFQVDASHQSE